MKEKTSNIQRLAEVLEWLYIYDGTFKTKNEWREELVPKLYFLADVEYPNYEGKTQGEPEAYVVE